MRESSLQYKDTVVKLWNEGYSLGQISQMITIVKRDTIRSLLQIENIDTKTRIWKTIPKNKETEIIEFYQSGGNISQAMKKFQIGESVFKRILEQHNVPYTPNNLRFEEQLKNLNLEYFKQLLTHGSLNLIYKEMGINQDISKRIIEHYKLSYVMKFPKLNNLDEETIENIMIGYYNCKTNREISKELNVPGNLVKRFLKKNKKNRNHSPVPPERIDEFMDYTKVVRKLTWFNILYQKLGKKEGYHWHHKFSVLDGFRNNVPPDLIASRNNLELITASENTSIGWRSKITLEEFKKMIADF
jgi:transposase